MSDMQQVGFEPSHNLSSGFVEWAIAEIMQWKNSTF